MPNIERDTTFLANLAEIILAAGNDRLADAILGAIESYERAPTITSAGNVVTLAFPAPR